MIRLKLSNTGRIEIENTSLPVPNPPRKPVAAGMLGNDEIRLFVGVEKGDFAGILYSFEDWQFVYPLQWWEAVGETTPVNPFVLDPVPLSHPPGVRLDIPSANEVAITLKKSATANVVEVTAVKPGVVTGITVDDDRPGLSIAIFLGKGQRGYVRFETWLDQKKGKRFRFPPK